MAQQGKPRTVTWWPKARPVPLWPDAFARFLDRAGQRIKGWALDDVGPGRLVPWLAIAFGFGIVLYFTAETEPALWAAVAVAIATIPIVIVARHRPVGFPIALAAAAIAAGFATATIKRVLIAHPVLPAAVWNAEIAGFVEVREERERSDRIVVRVTRIDAQRLTEKLERVRVSVRKGTAPAVGAFVV